MTHATTTHTDTQRAFDWRYCLAQPAELND